MEYAIPLPRSVEGVELARALERTVSRLNASAPHPYLGLYFEVSPSGLRNPKIINPDRGYSKFTVCLPDGLDPEVLKRFTSTLYEVLQQ